MNKVLVLVYVPLLEQQYDILIPINRKIGTIKRILENTIVELSDGNFHMDENVKLYDKETGKKLDNDVYVKNSGIVNGTKLILL